jgi:hypothetical protein
MEPLLRACFLPTTSPKTIAPSPAPAKTFSPFYNRSVSPSSITHVPTKSKKGMKSKGKDAHKKKKMKSPKKSFVASTSRPSHDLSTRLNIFDRNDVISGIHVKNVTM